jgi:hypothetical protein
MAYNPIRLGPTTTANSQAVVLPSDQVAIPVTGTFYQTTQPVSGTFYQATQPVSIAASVAVTGTFYQATQPVTVVSGATGGDSVSNLSSQTIVSAASTNPISIKASAGKVTGWYIYNSNGSARKVAFHNTAGTPTAGASVYLSLVIPALSAANVSFPDGIDFSTGIAITTVTGLANNDATAVALNDLVINIFYK